MNKFASAHREGSLQDGKGTISTGSGSGAHAGCFSMAFSMILGNVGFTPESIDTKVTLEKAGDGFSITKVHLDMSAKIPSIDDSRFQELAQAAKAGCPVSADISLDARLDS